MPAILRLTTGIAYLRSTSGTFTSTGVIALADGTAAAPSLTFTNDTDSNSGLYLIGNDNIGISLNGAIEWNLTTTAFSPGASDGNALGTGSLMWSDLFLASGGVINFNNGNVTLTHSAGAITMVGDTLSLTTGSIIVGGSLSAGTTSPGAGSIRADDAGALQVENRLEILSPSTGIQISRNWAGTDFTRHTYGTNDTATTGASIVKEVGHLLRKRGDGSTGTLTVANVGANSCGTTAATIVGTDNAFRVTVGATSGTRCRVTFVSSWTTAPTCAGNNETTANLMRTYTATTTTIDLAGTFVAGDVISVICDGY